MLYYIYKNEPNAEMIEIDAKNKKAALKKYNSLYCKKYRIISKDKAMGKARIEIVSISDYRNYNFSGFSYAVPKI